MSNNKNSEKDFERENKVKKSDFPLYELSWHKAKLECKQTAIGH